MRLALVGATGLVGQVVLKVLEEEQIHVDELILVASSKSVGQELSFKGKSYPVISLHEALLKSPDIAIFSAGSTVSLQWAPQFADIGCRVIDNSSAWRMDTTKKLIVPEVNGHLLADSDRIIANPNCSTIQLVLTLAPLHHAYGIRRVIVSTYQSVTGTGLRAVHQLENERKNQPTEMAYPYPIDKNCLPHCDDFLTNGYTKEEMKLVNETHKILDPLIRITATAVRVPVVGGHSESVNIEFAKDFDLVAIRHLLHHSPGLVVKDDPITNSYPMPKYAQGRNEVFVGRIRRDESQENTLNLWIVADNLRKGAATNAVQILKLLTTH